MKPIACALALIGSAVAVTACDIPNDCTVATGVVFLDQSTPTRDRLNRITWRESRNTPTARNGSHYGCFQIATGVHAARIRRLGFTASDMLRALPNAIVARSLFIEQGFRPWTL